MNLERLETITTKITDGGDKDSQIDKTLSIYSAFSRVTIDKNIYVDILKNRKNH